jgi:2-keto-3-deoxy-L-rhamnonate aldolase RhmA
MVSTSVKACLLERKVCIGSWLQSASPVMAEIMARSGFSWLAADCEHGDVALEGFANQARAVSPFPCVPFVRVAENSTIQIRRALDLGAGGVIVPLVNTAEEAAKAVSSAKYPPAGVRGFAFQRANGWGGDFDAYCLSANGRLSVVVMIESKEAVANIDSILAVKGVDGVFIGPYDLSGSYGIPGQTSHPMVSDACRKVSDACAKAGKSAGMHIVLPDNAKVEKAIADGFTFLALGMDTVFVADGAARALATISRGTMR